MSQTTRPIKAPFPYPGGKSKIADMVWRRFGNVDNYIEPFAGSLAVLLRRPADHFAGGYRVETANDANSYLVNFWRAVRADPAAVADYADWPVTEADLHARHKWLVRSAEAADWRAKMAADPDHYCPKIAGWWVWGQCCWIGSGWCGADVVDRNQRPMMAGFTGQMGQGVNGGNEGSGKRPNIGTGAGNSGPSLGKGVLSNGPDPAGSVACRQIPYMDRTGRGDAASHGRPQLADAYDIGRGVNGEAAESLQIPRLADHERKAATGVSNFFGPTLGTCQDRRDWLTHWMMRLADRLRLVRTCYGHWSRVCDSESTLTRLGTTGVFLDPPYPLRRKAGGKSRVAGLYATDAGSDLDGLRDEVLDWCRRWGGNSGIRVALCCYEGDGYEPLADDGWAVESWEANGGYGNQAGGGKAANAKRERVYFSPACSRGGRTLFDAA